MKDAMLLITLASLLFLYVKGDGALELNPLAKHTKDVNIIMHIAANNMVIIDMNDNRQCKEPTFVVRLSGASLLILNYFKSESANTFRFAYPPLLDPGSYFLEVLLLACEYVKPNNFTLQCLEDPQEGKNVLSLPYSFTLDADQVHSGHRPRWVAEPNYQPALLHTRYQRIGCVPACGPPDSELIPFNSYSWVGMSDYVKLLTRTFEMSDLIHNSPIRQELMTFCMIGASHARYLTEEGNKLQLSRVKFIHVDSRFPFQFDAEHYLPGCSYAIMGYGQWPLGWVMGKLNNAYTAQMYETEMREVFRRLQHAHAHAPVTTQIISRSMNYNGLASWSTSCPPTDFRTPQLVDVYNSILKRISIEFNTSFIDTTHVQGPMWDGGFDYHHPTLNVFSAEIQSIVHHALTYSLQHQRAPVLVPKDTPRGQRNTLVRFTDSEKVYLYAGGVMRAFVNDRHFTTLGYNKLNDQILTWDTKERNKYIIGPDLHYVKAFYYRDDN